MEEQNDKRSAADRPKHKGNIFRLVAFLVCLCVFIVSAVMVIRDVSRAHAEQQGFSALQAAVSHNVQQTGEDDTAKYDSLKEQNQDFVGWVKVEGTRIDYPVMLTPNDPEYYLHRDFSRNYSASGVPFIGEGCTTADNNILIYGHHMKNGSMFADITQYKDESYWKEHPYIEFDTTDEQGRYAVIAAFASKVYDADEKDVFRYYDYGGQLDEEAFDEYVAQAKASTAYDTGAEATYGDRLITLSTCSYHTQDGRFAVVAKKIA